MKRSLAFLAVAAASVAFGTVSAALAAGAAPAESPAQALTAQAAATSPPIYVPPRRGSPVDVAPAATRGGPIRHKIKLLAPDHPGLTVSAQPTLYMYVGEAARLQLMLAKTGDTAAPPVASARIDSGRAPSIVPLRTDTLGISLEPGVEYRLTVMALDAAGAIRATDSVQIIRVARPAELTAVAAGSTAQEYARVLASAGVWFDALDALGQAVAAAPTNRSARADRAALLDQAGMPEIAAFDRKAVP